MRNKATQVRITQWPDLPIPALEVVQGTATDDDGDGWLSIVPSGAASLPEELILRDLQSLDCFDNHAVVEFINRFGIVLAGERNFVGLPEEATLALAAEDFPAASAWELKEFAGLGALHVHQVGAALRHVQVATRMWVSYLEGDSPSTLADLWKPLLSVTDEGELWRQFSRTFTGLQSVVPHVVIEPFGVGNKTPDIGIITGMSGQLFNFVREYRPVRHCQFEGCGQWFVRQQGRSQKGISRDSDDVLYCSAACANAQAMRNHRRRRKAAQP